MAVDLRQHCKLPLLCRAVMAMFIALVVSTQATAREDGPAADSASEEICKLIEAQAQARRIPPDFLARLIWQESRFNHLAISPKGAQGIAQFMPATAAERALDDPFDIPSALAASAALLQELSATFGNVGLAAAAYNAGPDRVRRWLAGEARLPLETRNYVRSITGLAVEEWQQPDLEAPTLVLDEGRPFEEACVRLVSAGLLAAPGQAIREAAHMLPWGVQVAAHFSREVALSAFDRLRREFQAVLGDREPTVVRHRAPARGNRPLFAVRIGAETRAGAEALCEELRAMNGACVVMKN